MSLRDDGTIDDGGPGLLAKIFCAEGLIYVPTCALAVFQFIQVGGGQVTCNTREALELVLLTQAFSAGVAAVCIAPPVTQFISEGETYWRGLADFHASKLHKLVCLHIAWELLLLVYGTLSIVSTDYDVCSELLPGAVSVLMMVHGTVLFFRIGHHIMFPLGIVIYKRRNPLAVLPEAGRVANEMAEPTLPVESPEKTKQRIQQIVDTNFHKIQVAFNERKRLPTLTDPKRPVGKGQKKPRVAPAAIVVRPRSTK